ncbi:MAG: phenylacetic acid degradation protein PaaN [Phycisphaerales bacterium]
MSTLFVNHQKTLTGALDAIRSRGYWSAYPEVPSGKIYGENARAEGDAAYQARLNRRFELDMPGEDGWLGAEASPYGPSLGVKYPRVKLDALIHGAREAFAQWKRLDVQTRIGICLEILDRLNKHSFEMANAVMHTTGQGWMMAFQAGGPHAQDRGLEAVAYSWDSMQRTPPDATWTKRVGRDETVTLQKHYRIVPRGIAITIGCSTFPTWNSYPGIFASLATGNVVIVKPHPNAILPLAITVAVARDVLREQGIDPNVIMLAADTREQPITKELVMRPEVGIIDYTGGSAFGEWIETNATHARIYTEKAGVNSVILDSVENIKAVTGNLAFTFCLYSGQMCTTSQNVFVPKDGIMAGGAPLSFDEICSAIVKAIDWLLSEPARATEILGAINSDATAKRIDEAAAAGGTVVRQSQAISNEQFPDARVRTPLIVAVDADDEHLYMREMFGPIIYIIKTRDTDHSLEIATRAAREHGAITCAIYSTDQAVLEQAEEGCADAGVALSCNLTGSIWVNQAAAFSDFHVSGANPAGNATLTDTAFVAQRYNVVQSRIPVAVEAPVASAS